MSRQSILIEFLKDQLNHSPVVINSSHKWSDLINSDDYFSNVWKYSYDENYLTLVYKDVQDINTEFNVVTYWHSYTLSYKGLWMLYVYENEL